MINAPIQLYYTIADTNVADTVTCRRHARAFLRMLG